MVRRVAQKYVKTAEIHCLEANASGEIDDKPWSVICALDRGSGLDSSSSDSSSKVGISSSSVSKESSQKLAKARQTLEDTTQSDTNVGGLDVELLQRLVSKEGDAHIALYGILWNSSNQNKGATKFQYRTACAWLDELNVDYQAQEEEHVRRGRGPLVKPRGRVLDIAWMILRMPRRQVAVDSRMRNLLRRSWFGMRGYRG